MDNDKNTTRPAADPGKIDEYLIKSADPNYDGCAISFDEDSYCVTSDMGEFVGLDFEWFRAKCAERNWSFHPLPF